MWFGGLISTFFVYFVVKLEAQRQIPNLWVGIRAVRPVNAPPGYGVPIPASEKGLGGQQAEDIITAPDVPISSLESAVAPGISNNVRMSPRPIAVKENIVEGINVTAPGVKVIAPVPVAVRPVNTLPPFIQGAPLETVREFKKILRQPQKSYNQKLREVEELVSHLGPERQKLFREFVNDGAFREEPQKPVDQLRHPGNNALTPARFDNFYGKQVAYSAATTPKVSNKVKDYFTLISGLVQDSSLTEEERWQQVMQLYHQIEPDIRAEIQAGNLV